MWFELIGATTALLGGTTGTVLIVKHRQIPFSERKSIRNVRQALEDFVKGKIKLKKVNRTNMEQFTYKQKNFHIELYVYEQTTVVHLKDDELNGNEIFFDFEYHNKSKELLEINERSLYYERYGHFDRHQEVLKAFMKKVMSIDWKNLEKEEQVKMKEKYRLSEVTPFMEAASVSTVSTVYSFGNEELKALLQPYFSRYQYIKSQEGKLAIEAAHVIERDYNYLQLLCQHFETLGEAQQTKEFSTVKERIEEKIEQLDTFIALLEQGALYEFRKIAEVMKTDNRL